MYVLYVHGIVYALLTLVTHARGLLYLSCVCVSIRNFLLLVFSNTARQGSEIATQTASQQQYLDFKTDNFSKIAVLESYGVKSKRASLYANEQERTCMTELSRVWRVFERSKVIGG